MSVNRRDLVKSVIALGATAAGSGTSAENSWAAFNPSAADAPDQPLLNLEDYERAARSRIDPTAWEYISSGAADELTVRSNVESYRALRLLPHQLRDVSSVSTSINLLGHALAHPIMLAPTACHKLAHPEGEVATARGARTAGAGMVLSSYSTVPVDRVAEEKPPVFWFQLYVQERAYTTALVKRAVRAGASAIAVTIDTPVSGARNRQQRADFRFPENLPHISGTEPEHPLVWKDLEWIRDAAGSVPILLKGIMHPGDVESALAAGAAGLMVSNHGGRNLDTCAATIDALPAIVAQARGRVPVIVDGGIRRGTDVLKALARGANAVMIGRPYVYGLAVNGSEGVKSVVDILRSELVMAMQLTGCSSIAGIDRSILVA
jgi:4-hydroxymandelate oxidase